MRKKVKISKTGRAAHRSRVVRPAHRSKSKTSGTTRSLSESRLQSSTKTKKIQRRLSVAAQSDRRTSPSKRSAPVYDVKGKLVGKVGLPSEIFGVEPNNKLISQAVRVYLANQRLGTASTKTRGEVRGSTRKIQRQKGTGRARHGSIRAPIFVHGGIVFGPKPRDYSLKLPKKMRRLALFSALSSKATLGEIKVLKGFEKIKPKTKLMAKVIENLNSKLKNEKILLVLPNLKDFESLYKASRNIEEMQVILAASLNTYQVLDNKMILLVKDAIDVIKKTFLKN